MRGIEPRAFHMQSERSTTELHPRADLLRKNIIEPTFENIFSLELIEIKLVGTSGAQSIDSEVSGDIFWDKA